MLRKIGKQFLRVYGEKSFFFLRCFEVRLLYFWRVGKKEIETTTFKFESVLFAFFFGTTIYGLVIFKYTKNNIEWMLLVE